MPKPLLLGIRLKRENLGL